VLINFFRVVARFRRPILTAELILLAAVIALGPRSGWSLFPAALLPAMIFFLLAVLADGGYRPAVLRADPQRRFFDTPVSPFLLLFLTACLISQIDSPADLVRELGDDSRWSLDVAAAVAVPVALAALFIAAWRGPGVRLRPDGLVDRQAFGTLFVPWEAFAVECPAASAGRNSMIALGFRRPDLVRRRGIVIYGRRAILVRNTDPAFLAAIIDDYVRHPEHRAAIGSEAELHRLTRSGQSSAHPHRP
jgi:hypothetical protein